VKRNKRQQKKAADRGPPEETILVTGGSRGIGREICLRAADAGYRIVVNYKENTPAARVVVNAIRRKGGTAIPIRADVSKEQESGGFSP
jgi:NAD(P)-dependent dehydrogenase (short-subunit alcohol dehydrogenase family)